MKNCPSCGKEVGAEAVQGLCPACLMQVGLGSGPAPATLELPPLEELRARFPQLEIIELIGKGGMGAVYRARQKQLDRVVALKILPPGAERDAAFAARFTTEARALAKLNHPNIVTIHDFGCVTSADTLPPTPDTPSSPLFFFVMEFVDGMNLRQLLNAGRIAPREALAIVPQICDALQYAHDHGIVHRDIKPENILLDRQGRVKVADFGLAKLVGVASAPDQADPSDSSDLRATSQVTTTEAGVIMGTPQYMAPEQREHPTDVDHRADIYSLGVVFYQMLTGELPKGDFAAPSKKVLLDIRLDAVVLRALEKTPGLRFQQVSEVKTLVETIATTPAEAGIKLPRKTGMTRMLEMFFDTAFTSPLAIKLANFSGLGFLGSLGFLRELPGWERCAGLFGLFGIFGLVGFAFIVEIFFRARAARVPSLGKNGPALFQSLEKSQPVAQPSAGRRHTVVSLLLIGGTPFVLAAGCAYQGLYLQAGLCVTLAVGLLASLLFLKIEPVAFTKFTENKFFYTGLIFALIATQQSSGPANQGFLHDSKALFIAAVSVYFFSLWLKNLRASRTVGDPPATPPSQVPSLGKNGPSDFQSLENGVATTSAGGRIAYVLFALLYLGSLVCVALSAQWLPERVATHFGFEGAANGWMTRTGYLVFVSVFPLVLALFFAAISALIKILPTRFVNIPNRAFWLAPERRATTALLVRHWLAGLLCLLMLFFAGLHALTIVANRSTPPHLPMGGLMLIVIVFLLSLMLWLTMFLMRFAEIRTVEKSATPLVPATDGRTWTPFQSQLIRDICAHMTEAEKRDATKRGVLFGLWNAGTFFLPVFFICFSSLPSPMGWVYGGAALVIGLAFYPLLIKMQKEFLCTTAWARQRGIRPEQLKRFGRHRAPVPNLGKTDAGTFPLDSARGRQSLENPPPVSRVAIVMALLVIGVVAAVLVPAGADGGIVVFITILLLLKLGLRVWLRRALPEGAQRSAWAPTLNSLLTQFVAALPLLGFMLFILPKFAELAKTAHTNLPTVVDMVIRASGFLTWHYGILWLLLAASGVIGWRLWRSGGAQWLRRWTLTIVAALFMLFVVTVAAVVIPGLCFAPQVLHGTPARIGPPFTADYPHGSVELVALASLTETNAPGWLPDGMVSKEKFSYGGGSSWAVGMEMKEIAFRIRSRTGTAAGVVLRFDERSGVNGFGSVLKQVDPRTPCILLNEHIACPPAARTVNLRVGVADGPWQTVDESSGTGGGTTVRTGSSGTAWAAVAEREGQAVVTVARARTDEDVRVLAVGKDGQEHTSSETRWGQAGAISQLTVTFRGLLPKDIAWFRLQRRPYQWVEFRNVSLQRGHKTTVEVVGAAGENSRPVSEPPSTLAPAFGPAVEREFGLRDADGQGLVFFSTERNHLIMQPPFPIERHGCAWIGAGGSFPEEPDHAHVVLTEQLKQWAATNQVDFVFSFKTNGTWCFNSLENRTRCIRDFSQPEQFGTITPAEAAASLDAPLEKAGRYVTSTGCSFGYDTPFRNMLAFRTRSGALGILQWSGMGAPANTLKIRYKLAPARNTQAAAPQAKVRSSPTSQSAPQTAASPSWFTLVVGLAAFVVFALLVSFAIRGGRKSASATPEQLAGDKARRRGSLAMALCLGGLLLPVVLLALGQIWPSRVLLLAWLGVLFLTSALEIAALVLGIMGWKSGAGKAAVIVAAVLPLLAVPGTALFWLSARAAHITTEKAALEATAKQHFNALLVHEIDQHLRQENICFKTLSVTLADDLTRVDIQLAGLSKIKNLTDAGEAIEGALVAEPTGPGRWEIRGQGQLGSIRFSVSLPVIERMISPAADGIQPRVRTILAGERVELEKKLRLAVAQWFNENGSMCESVKVTTQPDLASVTVEWRGIRNLQSSLAGESGMFLLKQTGVNEWSGSHAGTPIRLRLDVPPTVGLIVDGDGRPLPDVLVRQQDSAWQATTDASGRFPLPALTNNQQISLTLQAHGFAKRENVSLFRDSVGWSLQPVRFMLRRTAQLSGRVLAPTGKPLAYAPLSLTTCYGPYRDGDLGDEFRSSSASGSIANAMRTISDDQGNWRIDDVPAGTHILYYPWEGPTQDEFEQERWRALKLAGREVPLTNICGALVVNVRDGQNVGGLVLDLARSTCRITGRVLDQHGQPVVGAAVNMSRRAEHVEPKGKSTFGAGLTGNAAAYSIPPTDAAGRYEIHNFPPGDWKVRVTLGQAETSGELRLTAAGEHATLNLCLTRKDSKDKPIK